ncbi:MAG TPA: YceI family protein, partial [Phenylobacterium sp.]|nr:YceI family protein [Phenylobacterium sp.]
GHLKFDPAAPAAMAVEATIDPTSLELNTPPAGFHDELMGKNWFNAATFPAITYRSTKVEVTGPNTARVTGDLTLHGVTKPVVLDVTYNGGWPANAMDGARVGFSGHGVFKRSAFGIGYGVPAPGSNMGVSDEVEVAIETEFSGGKPVAKK